jgi:hypothetical protein
MYSTQNGSKFHQTSLRDSKRSSGSIYSTPNESKFHQTTLRDSKRSSASMYSTLNESKLHQTSLRDSKRSSASMYSTLNESKFHSKSEKSEFRVVIFGLTYNAFCSFYYFIIFLTKNQNDKKALYVEPKMSTRNPFFALFGKNRGHVCIKRYVHLSKWTL